MIGVLLVAAICNCEVCPERQNDFVWENDKFGMRAYGPGEYHMWSGFDVFNKNTSSNVCLRWCHDRVYSSFSARPNFHMNLGEGMDNYAMGASRGVGAVAMFADGEWKTYPNWETSRVIHTGDDYLEFELVYPAFSAAGKMTCHVTLRRGERFFRNDVSFERMPEDFLVGPGLDLEPKRDHRGSLVEESGLVSLFEDPKGSDGKDGSTMEAVFVAPGEAVEMMTDPQNCRVLAFRGRKHFTYWAGVSWSLAGEITTANAWHGHVRAFRSARVGSRVLRTEHGAKAVDGERVLWEFSAATDKPCIHPLALPDGTVLTAAREQDHPWHRGLWFAWKYLNGVNFWETDASGESEGEQRVRGKEVRCEDLAAFLRMDVDWGPRGDPSRTFLSERREVRIAAPAANGDRVIEWRATFVARERTEIGRTPPYVRNDGSWGGGYAGFSLRLAPEFASAATVSTSCGATSQKDIVDEEREWIDYSMPGRGGIRLEVLKAPGRKVFYHWADRRFTNLSPVFDRPLTLEKGETLELAYRATVHR